MTTVDWEIEQYNLCAVQRFADEPEFRARVILAGDMAHRMVHLLGLTHCQFNHTLDYRRAAAIAIYLTEETASREAQGSLHYQPFDGGGVIQGANHAVWLDADECVVDDNDVCRRGDHPTATSECVEATR